MALTRVYLIRHAQAEGNLTRRFHGITDADITETGAKQLEELKKRCADFHFDVAYSSNLQRAIKTAKAAIGDRNIELRIEPDLHEMDIGDMEDVPYPELPIRFGDAFRVWTNEPYRFAAPGGETMEQVRDRMHSAFTGIVKANEGKDILMITHGCALRTLLCKLKGIDFEQLKSISWCENTAIYIMEVDEQMNVKFLMEEDIAHLPPELSPQKRRKKHLLEVGFRPRRMLGIDYGDARTGLALSDESRLLASPAGTIKETDPDKILEKAAEFALGNNCAEIIVGFPLNMNGTRGPRAEKVADFAYKLEMKTGIHVYYWDERLTTVGATAYMNATDFKGKKRKDNIDTASACLILQGYLDYIRERR